MITVSCTCVRLQKALFRSEHATGRRIRKGMVRVNMSGKGVDESILGPIGTEMSNFDEGSTRRVGSKD